MQTVAIVASGTTGFLVAGLPGATAGVLAGTAAIFAWWCFGARRKRPIPTSVQRSPYLDVEDIIDQLDELARERGWDSRKMLEIARMACEHRGTSIDELEWHYDQGLRSSQDQGTGPKDDDSTRR